MQYPITGTEEGFHYSVPEHLLSQGALTARIWKSGHPAMDPFNANVSAAERMRRPYFFLILVDTDF